MTIRGTGKQELARGHWMEACQFHDLSESEVLREVSRRVKDVKARAGSERTSHPLVLLDLDSTLFEVGTRTQAILEEWLKTPESEKFPRVRAALEGLKDHHLGYTLQDTFLSLGLPLQDTEVKSSIEAAKKFWAKRFFTSAYLQHDRVYPGAPEFCRELYELGAELVYLTGRDEPGMGEGTRQRLRQDGFPFDVPKTHLLLKEKFVIEDLVHKQNAAHFVRKHGTLIASFENEPKNLVAIYELFPDAMHVFVDTVCSEYPAMPCRGLYRIKGFDQSACGA